MFIQQPLQPGWNNEKVFTPIIAENLAMIWAEP